MNLPQKNEEYGTKKYWDQRYTAFVSPSNIFSAEINSKYSEKDVSFDWFKSYADIAGLMRELVPEKNSRILMLGCGNSRLSEDMYDDGYNNIVNVDYSSVVIEQMSARNKAELKFLDVFAGREMDVRALDFTDDSFDVAIDKGTMDAMLSSKGDVWDPPEQAIEDCTREVNEVVRVLKKDSGTFLYLTFGQPHFRKRYLVAPRRDLEIRELGEAFHYYLYILRVHEMTS